MRTVKMTAIVFLALALSLVFFGCDNGGGGGGDTTGLSQAEIEQMVNDALAANADVTTLSFDMDMTVSMEVIGGDEAGEVEMVMYGNGAIDKPGKEMKMLMTMSVDVPGEDSQNIDMGTYFAGGWMYVMVDIPQLGEQWLKMEMTDVMWEEQNQFAQQLELLRTAVSVNYLGVEAVDGIDCYVVQVEPDIAALGELLSQQQNITGFGGLDYSQFNMADLIKEMTIKEWIAEDGYLMRKAEVKILMEMSADDLGGADADFEGMVMDMEMVMQPYGYNEAVSIDLPAAAQQAIEMPGTAN